MRMLTLTVGVCVFLTGSTDALAQDRAVGALTGIVSDNGSGAPIRGARVTIEGASPNATTDSVGRYRLDAVPSGPQVILLQMLGYANARVPVTVRAGDVQVQDVAMAPSALELEGVTVTADPTGRARGELGTASVIEQEAIRHQTATSLAGVLELVPGVQISPPALDGVQQIPLRAAPTSNTARGAGPSVSQMASFGTLIILDGIPQSNNANLQTLGPRGSGGFASSAGGGIDLRTMPASTIERVEVIRGVPSARFGDLTQGAIVVDTRAGAVEPELSGKLDPRTGEASLVGGRRIEAVGGTGTLLFDIARTQSQPGLSDDRSYRLAGQLAHRAEWEWEGGVSARFDTRVDLNRLIDDRPENPNIRPDRAGLSRETGLRLSERVTLTLPNQTLVTFTGALARVAQRSFARSPQVRNALPFTDRLESGRATGRFVGGRYISELEVEGSPWMIYGRLEADGALDWLGISHRVRTGLELRREWNDGAGRQFDMEFPPQSSFNAVDGFDRPYRYDQVPPLVTSALYVDDAMRTTLAGRVAFNLQAGLRVDLLHEGSHWASGLRDVAVQPRFNAELQPWSWLRLRGGWGRSAKLPTLLNLFPWPQYYDVVNVNWYAADPAERLAILTTYVVDPTNEALGMSVADKAEAGFELGFGRSAISVVGFRDRIRGGIGISREPSFLLRDRFELSDSTQGTGRPPEIIEPPTATDTVPILIDRPANTMDIWNRGVEVTAAFPEIPAIRTRLQLQASWVRTQRFSETKDFGPYDQFSDFQIREVLDRLPYWESITETGDQALATYRVIHHQPDAGLVVTATIQHNLFDRIKDIGATDTLSYAGYLTRDGRLVEVSPGRRSDPEFADLRRPRRGGLQVVQGAPADWLMSIQVSKTLPLDGRLSFWSFNLLDRQGTFGDADTRSRLYPQMRFGVEVSMLARGLLPS